MTGEEYIEFSNRPDFDPSCPENLAEIKRQAFLMARLGFVGVGGQLVAGLAGNEQAAEALHLGTLGGFTGCVLAAAGYIWVSTRP
jgi:hypothetical protein